MNYEYKYSENCVFKNNCPRERRVGCNYDCPIQPEIDMLLKTSNLPNEFIDKKSLYPEQQDLKTFETLDAIRKDIVNFTNDGRFLYLWSHGVGVGKTSWVIKIVKTYLAMVCIGNCFKPRAWFEYLPTFVLLTKEFNNDSRQESINNLRERDLVIIDDIGSINSSNYDITTLSSIIDYRCSHGKATLFTSNLSPQELEKVVGVRLTDRVASDIVLELRGSSRRVSTNEYVPRGR